MIFFSLSSTIILSAKTPDNIPGTRQISVPPASNHLGQLNRLNQLSRRICAETPPPETLAGLLEEAESIKEYSTVTVIIGQLIAMTSLGVIFGGSPSDIAAVDLISFVLFWMIRWLNKPNLTHIIVNTLCMWAAGTLAIFCVKLGSLNTLRLSVSP